MDLTDVSYIIDMYAPGMGLAFTTSFVAFFMYMMLQIIELRSFVESMNIFEVELTSRSTFFYAHFFGYFVLVFKIIIKLMVVVVLLTVVVWLILAMTQIFVGGSQSGGAHGGGFESAAHFRGGNFATLGDRMQRAALAIGRHLLGVLFERNFLMLLIVVNAVFVLFFFLIFVQFYDRDKILDLNQDEKTKIAKTNHNFGLLVITTIVTFALMKTGLDYGLEILDMRIGTPPS